MNIIYFSAALHSIAHAELLTFMYLYSIISSLYLAYISTMYLLFITPGWSWLTSLSRKFGKGCFLTFCRDRCEKIKKGIVEVVCAGRANVRQKR